MQNLGIEAAVIASAGEEAQGAADKLVVGGVRAMLNLTPVVLVVPAGVAVRSVDIASELMMLSYYCGENSHKNAQSVIIARNETKTEEA